MITGTIVTNVIGSQCVNAKSGSINKEILLKIVKSTISHVPVIVSIIA